MKIPNYIAIALILFSAESIVLAQPQPIPGPTPIAPPQPIQPRPLSTFNSQNTPELTRFSLDFPGGTPKQLAAAIEKAMGKPLNVIVPDEFADTKLPPIKVTGVTVPQLFQTLSEGSRKYYPNSGSLLSSYGFQTTDKGIPSDDSIWNFYVVSNPPPAELTKFDLDFQGGTPRELVAAIQKAMHKPLNAIVPEQYVDLKLPPLKMNNVNVSQLFQALESASRKSEAYTTGTSFGGGSVRPINSYQIANTAYGFRTSGNISDDSVWYFFYEKPALPTYVENRSCRFYLLTPYLDRGLTVDDITTAIQSGWRMLGEKETPRISFHKETKLLIAVGEPGKLEIIDSVLKALEPGPAQFGGRRPGGGSGGFGSAPRPAPEKPAEQPKTDE
jgi:hypothetical protein